MNLDARSCCAALIAILKRERDAVAALNVKELETIAVERDSLIEVMKATSLDPDIVAHLKSVAEANRALMEDALSTIKQILIGESAGTYDAKARMRSSASSMSGQDV